MNSRISFGKRTIKLLDFKTTERYRVKDAKVVISKNGSGQVGISYMKRGAQTIKSLDNYKLFIADKPNGLTKIGQLLFQQSVESYVYCVLGAQANTRWPIVEKGAMSIQTQEVFKKLVNDTIIQNVICDIIK